MTHPGRALRLSAVTRRYNLSSSTSLPVWVENWVENRRCLESVETGAAWSRSMHSNTRTPGGSSHGCSVHCRYSEYMTVMKSDCQPVSAPDGSAALPIPYRRKCSVTPIRSARIGESARSAHVKPAKPVMGAEDFALYSVKPVRSLRRAPGSQGGIRAPPASR